MLPSKPPLTRGLKGTWLDMWPLSLTLTHCPNNPEPPTDNPSLSFSTKWHEEPKPHRDRSLTRDSDHWQLGQAGVEA